MDFLVPRSIAVDKRINSSKHSHIGVCYLILNNVYIFFYILCVPTYFKRI